MKIALVLVVVSALTVLGDYFIKIASLRPNGLLSLPFLLGMTLYAMPAIGWFYLMRSHSLAVISVLYSAAIVVLLTGLSIFSFKESFGWREGLGISFAILAVVVVGLR